MVPDSRRRKRLKEPDKKTEVRTVAKVTR